MGVGVKGGGFKVQMRKYNKSHLFLKHFLFLLMCINQHYNILTGHPYELLDSPSRELRMQLYCNVRSSCLREALSWLDWLDLSLLTEGGLHPEVRKRAAYCSFVEKKLPASHDCDSRATCTEKVRYGTLEYRINREGVGNKRRGRGLQILITY